MPTITNEEYKKYLGVDAPLNFERLLFLSIKTLDNVMINGRPSADSLCYEDYKKALMEQINYFDENPSLLVNESSEGHTLGKYSESGNDGGKTNESIKRLSPMAYDILLACGLAYQGLGGC